MSDTYFNTGKNNNPNEKLQVMSQEIGHTFCPGHTSEDGSSQDTCMDYFSNTGIVNAGSTQSTHPNLDVYGQLTAIYSQRRPSTPGSPRRAPVHEAPAADGRRLPL